MQENSSRHNRRLSRQYSFIVLIRPRLYGENLSQAEGSTSQPSSSLAGVCTRKQVDPFARADSARTARACSDCPDLTGLTALGGPQCLLLEKSWPGYEDVPTIPKG